VTVGFLHITRAFGDYIYIFFQVLFVPPLAAEWSEILKALVYEGIKNVKVAKVEDPKIEKADDVIIKVTSTAICGSDLHLIHGDGS
jgi:hypothetical protein